MGVPKIKHIRASVVRGGGGDYHDVDDGHWIDDHIATPMARYPEFRASRRAFGANVLGTLVVEVEGDDGTTGFAIATAGEIGAYIVEMHLARFIEGRSITDIEKTWDQMYNATIYYCRRGIVVNAISAVELAMWDLLAKWRKEPVHALVGAIVREELVFYVTGARPDIAKQLDFIGGKLPLQHGPAEGDEGLKQNLAKLEDMRDRGGCAWRDDDPARLRRLKLSLRCAAAQFAVHRNHHERAEGRPGLASFPPAAARRAGPGGGKDENARAGQAWVWRDA